MSGRPGSLNYLLTRPPMLNSQAVPGSTATLPSIPTSVEDGVRDSLKCFRAHKIFGRRVAIAVGFAAAINLMVVYWMIAANRILRFELSNSMYGIGFIPLKYMCTSGFLYTVLSTAILTGLVLSFSYQGSWTRLQMTSRLSRVVPYKSFPAIFQFWSLPLAAGCLARCYLGLIGYKYNESTHVEAYCDNSERCLDERNLFITFCAAICGLFSAIQFRVSHEYIIQFSIIPLPFIEGLRTLLRKSITGAVHEVVKPIMFFYLMYYLQGDYLIDGAVEFLRIPKDSKPLARLSNILSVDLLLCTYTICVIVVTSFKMTQKLFQLCITQRLKFPIEFGGLGEDPNKMMLLSEGMRSASYFLKYLAFYDLKQISENEEGRLVQIFKLSHPGCHPRNWMNLMHPCVNIVEDAGKAIKSVIEAQRKSKRVGSSEEYVRDPRNPNIKVLYSSLAPLPFNGDPRAQTYRRVERNDIRNLARHMENVQFEQLSENPHPHPLEKLISAPAESIHVMYGRFTANTKFGMQRLLTWSKFILTPDPMAHIMKEVAHFRLLVWSAESLTNIACASLTQDVDGAVQHSLGKIISVQIEFFEILSEIERETGFYSEISTSGNQHGRTVHKYLLKTFKNSLARLYHHFYPHLAMIQICPKLVSKWKAALDRGYDEDIQYQKEKLFEDSTYTKHKDF